MSNSVPNIELISGVSMPQLGFGVWQIDDDKVVEPVKTALEAGYRLIDTAQGYGNEAGVGKAIRSAGIDRDQLFITTKLDNPRHGFDNALRAFDESLARLQLEKLDLFLIHWPLPMYDDYVETWKAFIRLRDEGRVRSIGVSNFLPEHLDRLIAETGVAPALNQIELHPAFQQRDVRSYHAGHQIQLEAYSPLGSGAMLKQPQIAEIAKRLGKTVPQVILRWHIQQGIIVIPKSVTPDRIRSNFQLFDFELGHDDVAAIDALDDPAGGRTGSDPATFSWRG